MSKSLLNKAVLLLALAGIPFIECRAQQDHHQYEAALNAVPADGFYKIALKPEIIGKSWYLHEDIRILNSKKVQVPYVDDVNAPVTKKEMTFPIIEEATGRDKQYYIVVENAQQATFERLWLKIKNSDATRALTVSGSDDRRNWYAVREDFNWELEAGDAHKGLNSTCIFSLPSTNYKYLRITFLGKGNLPIKVMEVSTYGNVSKQNEYLNIPDPVIQQKDSSDKKSYVTLIFDQAYTVDKLELDVSGPKFFRRFAQISTNGYQEPVDYEGTMISSGIQSIYPGMTGTKICIVIDNADSPPLNIKGVHAFQERRGIIAYLEAAQTYKLTFGDSTAHSPQYDLAFFKDSIGHDIPELGIGPIKKAVPAAANAAAKSTNNNRWILWPILIALLVGLLYITFKMVKQMGKEDA